MLSVKRSRLAARKEREICRDRLELSGLKRREELDSHIADRSDSKIQLDITLTRLN